MASSESVKLILELQDNMSAGLGSAVNNARSAFAGLNAAARNVSSGIQSSVGGIMSSVTNTGGGLSGFGSSVKSAFETGALSAMYFKDQVVAGTQPLLGMIGSVAKGIGNFFFDMSSQAKWASAFATAAMIGWGESLVSLAAKFERFGYAADFILRDTGQSTKDFADAIRSMAKDTMFNVDQMADMFQKLVGNTKDLKLSERALRAISDAVAATGGSYSELEGATRAWIQTNSKGTMSLEELNRQFANANIPMIRLLAEMLSKDATDAMWKYIGANQAGKMSVDEIAGALQNIGELDIPGKIGAESMIKAMNLAFGGANLELLKSFDGQMSLIGDTLKLTALSFMGLDESFKPVKGGILDLLKSALIPILKFLNEHQVDLVNFAQNITKSVPAMTTLAGIIIGIALPAFIMLIGPLLLMGAKMALLGAILGTLYEVLSKNETVINFAKRIKELWDQAGGLEGILSTLKVAVTNISTKLEEFGSWVQKNKLWLEALALGILVAVAPALIALATIQLVSAIVGFANFALSIGEAILKFIILNGTMWLNIATWIVHTAWVVISNITIAAWTVIVWLANAATVAWGIVIGFLTSPIGLVILAIIALILCGVWLMKHWEEVKVIAIATWDMIVQWIRSKVMWVVNEVQIAWINLKNKATEIWETIKYNIGRAWDAIKEAAGTAWAGICNAIIAPIRGVVEWLDNAIRKARELLGINTSSAGGGGGSRSFAHGGVIPGAYGQAVPIIAHAGERVIPTGGMDVNSGGGSSNINISFSGPINMDSEARVNELAQKIIRMIGRQNELAHYGIG